MNFDKVLYILNRGFERVKFKIIETDQGAELIQMGAAGDHPLAVFPENMEGKIFIQGMIHALNLKEYDDDLPLSPPTKSANILL